MSIIKKYITFIESTISLSLIKVIELVIAILVIPLLTSKLGIENYGIYIFAVSLVLFFMNILNYGFNLDAVRELAIHKNNPQKVNQIFNEVMNVKFYLLIFSIIILTVIISFFPFVKNKTVFFAAATLLIPEFFSLRWFYLGLEKFKTFLFVNAIGTLIYILFVFFIIHQKTDFIKVPILESIAMLLPYWILFIYVIKKYQIHLKWMPLASVKIYLIENVSSFINLLLPSVLNNLAIFLIGIISIPLHVTYAQISFKFTNVFTTANTILTKAFYPIVNRDFNKFRISKIVLLSIGIVLSLTMFFGGDWLIAKWLHKENRTAIVAIHKMVKILSFVPFLSAVISSYGVNGLVVLYKDKLLSYITLSSTAVLVILTFVLTPIYSYLGVAYAMLISRSLYAIATYNFFKKANV